MRLTPWVLSNQQWTRGTIYATKTPLYQNSKDKITFSVIIDIFMELKEGKGLGTII